MCLFSARGLFFPPRGIGNFGKEKPMAYLYFGTVPSEISKVCSSVSQIIRHLKSRCKLTEDCLWDIRLILSELMINGCDHGNMNDRNKLVTLELMVDQDQVRIIVKDEGGGIQWEKAATADIQSCSGRGLRIVQALCDEMTVEDTEVRCALIVRNTDP